MKTAKSITSAIFLAGLLILLIALFFVVTGNALMLQIVVLSGLGLITVSFVIALVISTKEQQRINVAPGPKDAPGSAASTVMDILLALVIRL